MAPLVGLGWSDIELHMGLGLAALAFAFALFSFGWIGGGDAKLFAATCLWLGPETHPCLRHPRGALWRGPCAGCCFSGATIPLPSMLPSQGWLMRLHSPKEGVPYGIALAAAGLLVYRAKPLLWPRSAADSVQHFARLKLRPCFTRGAQTTALALFCGHPLNFGTVINLALRFHHQSEPSSGRGASKRREFVMRRARVIVLAIAFTAAIGAAWVAKKIVSGPREVEDGREDRGRHRRSRRRDRHQSRRFSPCR